MIWLFSVDQTELHCGKDQKPEDVRQALLFSVDQTELHCGQTGIQGLTQNNPSSRSIRPSSIAASS